MAVVSVFSLLNNNLCLCFLFSHLPGWPWSGGVFLQLPALHFQVQVPWIPLQVTIATVQSHCTDARTSFHPAYSTVIPTQYTMNLKITEVDTKSLQSYCRRSAKIPAKTGSIHSHYFIDPKTAVRLETLAPQNVQAAAPRFFLQRPI